MKKIKEMKIHDSVFFNMDFHVTPVYYRNFRISCFLPRNRLP